MIRSTTDEMLAARHDKTPWVDRNGGRYAHPRLTGAPLSFAPRVECIPSRDIARPEPNPILVRLRAIADRDEMYVHEYAPSFLPGNIWQWAEVGTPEQIEDARKVLTRLVGVFG